MKPTLLYIHGLGSDRNSRKFLNLKDYFKDQFDYDFLEWENDSNIQLLIEEKLEKFKNQENLIIVGDSTGANFAYQLRELRNCKSDHLILTSPLLDIERRVADFDFPKAIVPYLQRIISPKNAMIIATKSDEILDQNWIFDMPNNDLVLLEVKDNHRLINFHHSISDIESYLLKK